MPYLGNEPAEAYSNIAYQDFGTQSGTTFTLDFPVGAPGELEVFVNNVRQEPSVAYTVSGTTLTMTGTVAATDDFYVVFQGKAQQTVTHPANTALVATSGTFSGDLTVDTDTLKVDSTNNRVGIGTASPAVPLHVKDSAPSFALQTSGSMTSGNRADFSVFNSDTGTVGLIRFGAVTDNVGTDIQFFNRPAGGSLTELMRLDAYNGVRIGTASHITNSATNEKLTVDGGSTGQAATFSTSTSGGFPAMYVRNTLSGTVNAIIFRQGSPSATVGSITMAGGSSTAYNTSSDYRLKTAVTYDWDATTRLKQLKPARFKWIVAGDDAVFVDGFLAHEAQAVVPEAVTGTKDEVDADGNAVMQGIDQSKIVPLLVKTIIELEARIAALEAN